MSIKLNHKTYWELNDPQNQTSNEYWLQPKKKMKLLFQGYNNET